MSRRMQDIFNRNSNLEIHIQPFYNISKQDIVGAEALIRGTNGNNGESAHQILQTLKSENRLVEFDLYMIKKLSDSISRLNSKSSFNEGGVDLEDSASALNMVSLNINITPETIATTGISHEIVDIIDTYGVKNNIVLELHEDTGFSNPEVSRNISNLITNGVSLSLDDFNVMNENINTLARYNVKEVKIREINTKGFSVKQEIIYSQLRKMLTKLNLNIVFEGIETPYQCGMVNNMGFDTIQGYLVSKPIPLSKYTYGAVRNLIAAAPQANRV